MAGASFDITTGCDLQEVDNAINQTRKEISQRYDFKGVKAEIDFQRDKGQIVLTAPEDYQIKAIWDVLNTKMVRRQVPLKNLHAGDVKPAGAGNVRQEISLQQGIPTETARSIVKFIKDRKLKKVQASIQGEQVRVTSPKRDDLQTVISLLKQEDFGVELHFGNYRG
jgi:uncharacterized protein YajQ (UPF0234 family)